ncbi:MAG: hypothetical protein K2K90_02140 [Lachnospiraceae bacterium]|nr:hypothetical protein [Lachnospiraceae bacterium]
MRIDKTGIGGIMPRRIKPIQRDLRSEYGEAVENIRGKPTTINSYRIVFSKILGSSGVMVGKKIPTTPAFMLTKRI